MWYYHQCMEDQNSDFNDYRDLIEYQVSFFEPKMVQDIIKERKAKETQKTNQEFAKQVKDTFGRTIEFGGKIESGMKDMNDVMKAIQFAEVMDSVQRKTKDPTLYNFRHWLDFNLE